MRSLIERFVPRGSVVLIVTTFGSYVLGLVRDRIFAQTFGASASLDAYNAAFLVPDFGFNVLVASGIAAAAVPLFIEIRQHHERHAFAYMNAMIVAAVTVMLVMGAGTFIFAPFLSRLVAPGLDGASQELVTHLMRVLAIPPVIFAVSNALGSMLVAKKRFFLYGVSPMLYNLGIIVGALGLAPHFGIMGVAYGTIAGAFLHAAIRLIDAWRSGWRWYFIWPLPWSALRRSLRLMVPKMFGHPVELVTFWLFTSLASSLSAGSITVLNFARNFQSVPVSLLGITMATAVFPALAEAALVSTTEVRRLFYRTTGLILAVSTAAAGFVYLIRRPLVAVLLGGGEFDAAAVERTALTLGVFCLSIPTESLSHLFARAFYARQNTTIPVVFSLVSLIVAGGSAYVLSQRLGIVGLPLGFFFGSVAKTIGLWLVFTRQLRGQASPLRV